LDVLSKTPIGGRYRKRVHVSTSASETPMMNNNRGGRGAKEPFIAGLPSRGHQFAPAWSRFAALRQVAARAGIDPGGGRPPLKTELWASFPKAFGRGPLVSR